MALTTLDVAIHFGAEELHMPQVSVDTRSRTAQIAVKRLRSDACPGMVYSPPCGVLA